MILTKSDLKPMITPNYRHITTDPNDRKEQHTVPRSYLTAWCDPTTPDGAYIWTVPKNQSSEPKRRSPRTTFTVADVNTLAKGGERHLGVEAAYELIETAFGNAKRKIITGVEPTNEDIQAVVCFVAAQMVRTPKFRSGWQLVSDDTRRKRFEAIEEVELRSAIEKTTTTVIENGTKIVSLLALPQAIESLGKMRATFLKVADEDDIGFVTSDSPCCVIEYADQTGNALQCMASPTGNVLMSLCPSVAVVFDHSPHGHEMIHLFPNQPRTHEMNALLWRGAVEWVVLPYGKTRPEWFSEIVTNKLARYAII